MRSLPIVAVVTRSTRMQNLKHRWVTASNVRFQMQQAATHQRHRLKRKAKKLLSSVGESELDLMAYEASEALSDDDDLRDEDATYNEALKSLLYEIDMGYPIKKVDRDYISNFDFEAFGVIVP